MENELLVVVLAEGLPLTDEVMLTDGLSDVVAPNEKDGEELVEEDELSVALAE